MTSTVAPPVAHPIAEFTARLGSVLDGLAETAAWSLTRDQRAGVIVDLARQRGAARRAVAAGRGRG